MTRTTFTLALAVSAALAGCNKEDHTIVSGPPENDPAGNVAANGPIALPPSITATKTYRCADNSVVTIDYLSDPKLANVHVKDAPTVQVATTEDGQPMTAEGGYELSGSADAPSAKIAVPGHPSQTCKA